MISLTPVESWTILIAFTVIYCYIAVCIEKHSERKQMSRKYKNQLFLQRCKKSHNYFQNYFYSFAVSNPRLLATELADMCVAKMTRKNLGL